MTSKMKAASRDETEMREAFKVFDRNGDGRYHFGAKGIFFFFFFHL